MRILTLVNSRRRNALDLDVLGALQEALAVAESEGVRCLVLRGEGEKAFCAGMDLNVVHPEAGSGVNALQALEATMQAVESAPPVVAYLNGSVYGGGCELACACDLRVARAGIELCLPPARLGLVYSLEGMARIAAAVGPARAKRMLLTAKPVDAATALSWGLVDDVQPARKAFAAAVERAEEIAENAPLALTGMKRALAVLGRPRIERRERDEIAWLQRKSFESADASEAFDAFRERRKPRFRGE